MLKAFPRDFVKYLEIVVVAVWDIIPWPENLIKKIEIKRSNIEDILEKKKHENDSKKITKSENNNAEGLTLEFSENPFKFPSQDP